MKISVVISVLNQHPLAEACYKELLKNTASDNVEFIIIDNQSDTPIKEEQFPHAKIVRNEKNIGVYPTFKQGFDIATGEIVAFLHSDVVVWEKDWDVTVRSIFMLHPELGLAGFIGSNEIDSAGGRGLGTVSNFQGKNLQSEYKGDYEIRTTWHGSRAEVHGKRLQGYLRGAVVDGCAMIVRRSAWEKIGFRENFPPHHFYDRLISTQMLEAGFHVGIIGCAFDHISGQTVNQEKGYHKMSHNWLYDNLLSFTWNNREFDINHNYDEDIYKLAEKIWLNEYRDTKHLIPIKING